MTTISSVRSLSELYRRAVDAPGGPYAELLAVASRNLGGPSGPARECLRWLELNALETGDEAGVVAEVNFCRDLVSERRSE